MGKIFNLKKTISPVKKISPTKTVLFVFFSIILVGALLLMLPISSSDGSSTGFLTALFTSTSATCVTGLSVVDTLSHWSRFGHTVILILIQCGGLGFMAFATIFSLLVRRRISLRERLVIAQLFSDDGLSGLVSLTKRIILTTLFFELTGALILTTRFIPEYGVGEGIFKSIFHSVSAFCNAGFDLFGIANGYPGSLCKYINDPLVLITLSLLIIIGGVGFFVWDDIAKNKSPRHLSFHTKLVLCTTICLLFAGTALFLMFEYSNPATIGNLSFSDKLLASFFQSTTTRTAGFYSFSQSDMTSSSKLLSIFLMFIGGSPSSTAGGIKTITLAVLIITAVSTVRNRAEISVFGRRISVSSIIKSVTLIVLSLFVTLVASIILATTNGLDMIDALFNSVSAFATVGLNTSSIANLNLFSKVILILLMYFGRVGILTFSIAFIAKRKPSKISYPDGKIIIG